MDAPDYYKTLGINKTATDEEIKSAYRKLARKLHPDLNPNDKEAHKKFQEINEANEVLSDPEKRKKYDQYGKDWKHAEEFEKAGQSRRGATGGGFGSSGGSDGYEFSGAGQGGDFSEFFESFFGGGGRRGAGREVKFKGQDYNAALHLSLQQAYETHKETITVNGKNIRITIPAGVEDGQVIRLKGYGGPGIQGGPGGDLFISFVIENDPRFRRDGKDIYQVVDLDVYTAILGGDITIDTLSGKIKLKVNHETQNGTKTRLKAKGFPVYKKEGEFGDLYITYSIKLPKNLSDKEKELFQQLANLQKQPHGK